MVVFSDKQIIIGYFFMKILKVMKFTRGVQVSTVGVQPLGRTKKGHFKAKLLDQV